MNFVKTDIPGVMIVESEVFGDDRGFFAETFHSGKFADHGINAEFRQDNHVRSAYGVLRGLHFQNPPFAQGKLLKAVVGEIFDVAVDIRDNSPTFGRWVGVTLSAENKRQLYIPPGFAHGYCVTSEISEVIYKCTELYHPESEGGIRWNDPEIGIKWPVADPLLSDKDQKQPYFRELVQADSRNA